MSFYRLKYLWPKNSTNATSIGNGLRCMQISSSATPSPPSPNHQLPAASSRVVFVHSHPHHRRHHHTLLQRSCLSSTAQQIHSDQVINAHLKTKLRKNNNNNITHMHMITKPNINIILSTAKTNEEKTKKNTE